MPVSPRANLASSAGRADSIDRADEQHFAGRRENWFADFGGAGRGTYCTLLLVCTPILANDKETNIGPWIRAGPCSCSWEANTFSFLGNITWGRNVDEPERAASEMSEEGTARFKTD